MPDSNLLTNTPENSHTPLNVTQDQSSEKSPEGIYQNSNLDGEEDETPTMAFCGPCSRLFKRKRNTKFKAEKNVENEDKYVKVVDDDKEIIQHKELDHTFTNDLSQVQKTVQDVDQVKIDEEPSSQPETPVEGAGLHRDQQIQEYVEKDETLHISEPVPTLKDAVLQLSPFPNLSEVPSQLSQPSMNVVVSSYKHSIISIEQPENETLPQSSDHETLTADVHAHSKTTVICAKTSVTETSKARTLRVTLRNKPISVVNGAKDLWNKKKVITTMENSPIFQGSTIHRSNISNTSDHEETHDYVNQSNNNAANDVRKSEIGFALPEPEKKPPKFLQLIREARAANMIPPSLPTPSYSWERKEFIEEDNCMVLPTRKPKKRDEKASSPSEAETASTENKATDNDINKPKPVPSIQDVIETMQKIKEAEAQLKARKERSQLDKAKDDSGRILPSTQSKECKKESVVVNYKERRRLRKEKEIEEAREQLMEATRNALKDRLEFNKDLKSANNSTNISKTLFGISTDDINYPNAPLSESEKCVDIVEEVEANITPPQLDDRKGDNSKLLSNSELKVDENAVVSQPNASETDSQTKFTKESGERTCKKIRKKNHSNKYSNPNSIASPSLLERKNVLVPQTADAPHNVQNLSMPQPIFIPVPICMSCFGVPQGIQPNYCNQVNHFRNSIAHRRSRGCSISSFETSTSSDSDSESYRQKSKGKQRLNRNKSSFSECTGFSASSFETESSISLTNSSFSMSPSDHDGLNYTTPCSSSSSFDTTSECSVLSSFSSNSEDESS
ncbi:unnamed protein product [Hymenolepis diminuta]|uniref:PAPA-1 domain-containing protein n=1 Tax=Hymenolepis diminuta TaxID=6216 RepID=A0A0R3SRX3_HYMDI|nr:unnamed protein product [Hymenolepis diminuta]VUZ47581.1 unnamed protein product [Hymenolepis diminuta]